MEEHAKESRIYRTFMISISLASVLCISLVFFIVAMQSRSLIKGEMLARARSHFNGIVLTRSWNADHGGVYVEKKGNIRSNPYLENPDITGRDGTVYTKINPSLMTMEISRYAEREGLFRFHMTSLLPLNPANKPDGFESVALESFERGKDEAFTEERMGDRFYFRYMAPLRVEDHCLVCHAKQGYKVDDIRGGISVIFDIDDVRAKLAKSITQVIIFAVITISLLLSALAFYFIRLRKKLEGAREMLELMATTDMLTGLYNRRHLMERFEEEMDRSRRLNRYPGCLMIDIDHFKSINDTYGHMVGDEVLKDLAETLKKATRPYDIVGRYGGEEFMIVLPDISPKDISGQAERIRAIVEDSISIRSVSTGKNITISIGASILRDDDKNIDSIIKRADEALYKAKEGGRNRVETLL